MPISLISSDTVNLQPLYIKNLHSSIV